jgi:transglutaminase-like putative cysteine protease
LQGNYRLLSMDNGDAVFDLDPEHPVGRYEATSDIAQPSPSQLRTASNDYPPEILLNYLQLPRVDDRVLPLAKQITASADNNYDKAAAWNGTCARTLDTRCNFRAAFRAIP